MQKYALIAAQMIAITLLSACARDIQNKDAVQAAIVDYLKARQSQTGLDVSMMQLEVARLDFSGSEARASVMFTPKTGGSGMQMNYVLDRKGNNWIVRGRTENGVNPHGAQGLPELPPNHPPVGSKE